MEEGQLRARRHTPRRRRKARTHAHQPGSFNKLFSFLLWIHRTQTNKTQATPSSLLSNSVVTCLSLFTYFFTAPKTEEKCRRVFLSHQTTHSRSSQNKLSSLIYIIFFFLIFHVLYAQCPSMRRCGHSPSDPRQLVLRTDGPRSPCTSTLGVCVTWSELEGGGGWARDNAALPLVTRGWLCLHMECTTAVTSHIRVVLFCFLTKDRALAWCTVFYQTQGLSVPNPRLIYFDTFQRSYVVFYKCVSLSVNSSQMRKSPSVISFRQLLVVQQMYALECTILENQPPVTSQRAASPRRYLSSVSERHLVPPSDY